MYYKTGSWTVTQSIGLNDLIVIASKSSIVSNRNSMLFIELVSYIMLLNVGN